MQILSVAVPKVVKMAFSMLSYVTWLYRRTPDSNVTMEQMASLLKSCQDGIAFMNNQAENAPVKKKDYISELITIFEGIVAVLYKMGPMVEEVRTAAPAYDLPGALPGNGYRTFVSIADKTATTAYRIIQECQAKVSSWDSNYPGRASELLDLLTSVSKCFEYLLKLKSWSVEGSLYPAEGVAIGEILDLAQKVDQQCFYGTFIANQFDESMRFILKRISLSMVSYSEIYYGAAMWRVGTRAAQYATSDKARGRRHVALTHHAGVDFIQAFWRHAENPVVMVPMMVANPIPVSEEMSFPQLSVTIDGVEVKPSFPEPPLVIGRLISKHFREGMPMAGKHALPKSRGLIIHVHGGGFVSQSARTQEIFLRKWAHEIDVPIFSIDYALAPAAPFPRAVHEVFYGYCVAITQAAKFGSTGERIVFAGDSAGANLILAAVQECIRRGVRLPHALFLAYVPVLVSFVPSPARLLGLMDPLLPFGVMMRCAKAYVMGNTSIEPWPPVSTCSCEECAKTSQLTFLDNPHLEFRPESFNVDVPSDPYMSPYEVSDEVMAQMPPMSLCASTFDPCLDDTIMFAKKLQRLGNTVRLDIVDGLPHGFLNFCWVNEATNEATRQCGQRISDLLDLASLPEPA